MKINKWYVAVERDDGKVERLYKEDLLSDMAFYMDQFIKEVEQSRNEEELA